MMVSTAHAALTITSNGADMSDSLLAAIRTHDTVILDGTKGEIILDHTVVLKHLEHKTIIGTHDACLRSRFRVTKDIRAMLDSAHVISWTIADGNVLRLIRRLMSVAKPPSLLTLPSSVRVSGLLTAPPPTPNVLYDSIFFIRAFKFHLVIRKMRKKLAYM